MWIELSVGLKRKTILIIAGMLLGMALVLGLSFAATMHFSSSDLEGETVDIQMGRATDAVAAEVDELAALAYDWGSWTDTYEFIQGDYEEYAEDNLVDSTFDGLSLNVAIITDTEGRALYAKGYDLENSREVPLPAGIDKLLAPGAPLHITTDDPAGIQGLVDLPDGPMLVAANPVLTSDDEGPRLGIIVFGRWLDDALVADLSAQTHSDLALLDPADGSLPPGIPTVALGETHPTGLPLTFDGLEAVTGHVALNGIDGSPVTVLVSEQPRAVARRAVETVAFFGLSLLALIIVAGAVFTYLLERSVVRPITGLSEGLSEITKAGDASGRVEASGTDEIGQLGNDINHTLSVLQTTSNELQEAHDGLELRISERTAELADSEARYRSLVENMSEAVLVLDLAGNVTFASKRSARVFSRSLDEIIGRPLLELLSVDTAEAARELLQACDCKERTVVEAAVLRPDGSRLNVELSGSAATDSCGAAQVIVRDITDRKHFEAQLIHVANHDHLTGTMNRRTLEEELGRILATATRANESGALMWLDVDDFKAVNDAYGHRAGDELLIELAARLREAARADSVVARLGGDEFAIVLPRADADEAQAAAERLLAAVRNAPFNVDGTKVKIAASMGVALFPEESETSAEVLVKADTAMYVAKSRGRGRIHIFQPGDSMDVREETEHSWVDTVATALSEERLRLHCQPVLDLETGAVSAYEVFVRLLNDHDELVLPNEFLPAAVYANLAYDVDRWVINAAVEAISRHSKEGRDVSLSVNLMGRSCVEPDIYEFVESTLEKHGVNPSNLGFEINETAAVADMPAMTAFARSVASLGCNLCLDDFGSGFSSFYYVKNLPLDCFKIDGSYVTDLNSNKQNQHMIKALVELGKGLGKRVNAEHVEDFSTLALLEEYGVQCVQGYHIRRPGPIDEVLSEADEYPADE